MIARDILKTGATGLLILAGGAACAETPARIEILPGYRDPDGVRHAGLRIALAPGWKTYWRSPGDGGIAPEFDFAASENLTAFSPDFPAPILFESAGMMTPGYTGDVVLPLTLVPADPSSPIQLNGVLSIGVCKDVCKPLRVEISAELAGAGAPDPRITAAQQAVPATLSAPATCRFEPISDGMRLTATLPAGAGANPVPLIEFADPDIWVSPAQPAGGSDARFVADLVPPGGAPFAIDRSALRITVISGGQAVEVSGCVPG